MDYKRDEHRMYLIVYHLIWCTKRRKELLTGAVAKDLKELVKSKCEDNGWDMHWLDIEPNFVHLVIGVFPTDSAARVVNQCKGITSKILREKYPELRKIPSLWTSSYFATTVQGDRRAVSDDRPMTVKLAVTDDVILKFIETQRGL